MVINTVHILFLQKGHIKMSSDTSTCKQVRKSFVGWES